MGRFDILYWLREDKIFFSICQRSGGKIFLDTGKFVLKKFFSRTYFRNLFGEQF